jgi:opacity protein-like surface antigen
MSNRKVRKTVCIFATLPLFIFLSIGDKCTAGAQTLDKTPPPRKSTPGIDISLGVYSQQTTMRMPTSTYIFGYPGSPTGVEYTQTTQGTAPSAGVLATFHQSFSPWLGYNINIGYSRFTAHYSNAFRFVPNPSYSSFVRGSVRTNMTETTVGSVIEGPHTKRFSTFAQIGGGGLFFNPISGNIGASEQTRPALLFGSGANFKLTQRLALRAEYRGLFYKSPDFNVTDITPGFPSTSQFPMTRLFTVTHTPTVSLVYCFGRAASTKAPNTNKP